MGPVLGSFCTFARHLMNSSTNESYDDAVRLLRRDLARRGYPLMPHVPYDAAKRDRMLQSIANRPKHAKRKKCSDSALMVFKCAFSPQLCHIGIRAAYSRLLRTLRCHLGDDAFLQDRLIVANPSSQSLFRQYYRFSFPRS